MINDLDEVQYAYLLAPTFQFVNSAGKPITGGWMEVYIHGTRTKYYCCSDWDGTLHPFKIPLDSLGSNIVLASPANAYDVYIYNRFGSLIMSRYNVIPVIGGGATGVVPVNISIESEDNTVDIEVSGNVYNLSISGTIDKLNTVSADVEELREAIATGLTQVQSDWEETDPSSPAYIQNKPDKVSLIAGDNIGIIPSGTDLIISASGVDTSDFATHSEVNSVSGILENEIQTVSAAIPDVSNFATHTEVNNVSGSIITVVNNVSSTLDNKIDAVSSSIPVVTGFVTQAQLTYASGSLANYTTQVSGSLQEQINQIPEQVNADWNSSSGKSEILNKPDLSVYATETELVSAINTITASIPQAQVQSDWTEDDTADPAYIKNKPDLSVYATNSDLQIVSAAIPNVSNFATKTEVNTVSGILENEIQAVSSAIPPQFSGYTSPSGTSYIDNTNFTIEQSNSAIDYVTTYDWRARWQFPITTVPVDNTGITPSTKEIKFQVPFPITGEIRLANNYEMTDYISRYFNNSSEVIFNIPESWVGNLVYFYYNGDTSQYQITGYTKDGNTTTTESVRKLAWEDDIPTLIAGNNITITATGSDYIISSTASGGGGGSGVNYNAGDHIDITDNTISVTGITELVAGNAITITASGASAIISSTGEAQVQSDWNVTDSSSKAYIRNKPSIPAAQIQSDWNQTNTSSKDYIKNKPTINNYTGASGVVVEDTIITLDEPLGIVAGSGINIVIEGDSAIICVSGVTGGGGSVTGNYQEGYGIDITNDTISVDTTVIPTVSAVSAMIASASGSNNLFIAEYGVTTHSEMLNAYTSGKYIIVHTTGSVLGNNYYIPSSITYSTSTPTNLTMQFRNPGNYEMVSYATGTWTESLVSRNYQVDWNETSQYNAKYIKNKPDLSVYTTSTQVSAIVEAATGSIPTPVQINSDWNATSGVAEILNKPVEANLLPGSGITIAASGSDYVINTTPIELVAALPANPVSGVLYLIPEA